MSNWVDNARELTRHVVTCSHDKLRVIMTTFMNKSAIRGRMTLEPDGNSFFTTMMMI